MLTIIKHIHRGRMKKLNINNTFIVMNEDKHATKIENSSTLYQELEQKFNGFKNHELISSHEFSKDWDSWEMHPEGDEVVFLLSGNITFVLETQPQETCIELNQLGDYVIIPKGTWHTAKTTKLSQILFITPGENTKHRS